MVHHKGGCHDEGYKVVEQVFGSGAVMALVAGMASTPPAVYAGGTIKADDDKWISVGMGIRTSFNAI